MPITEKWGGRERESERERDKTDRSTETDREEGVGGREI